MTNLKRVLLTMALFGVFAKATPTEIVSFESNHTLYIDRDPEVIQLFTDSSCPEGKYTSYRLSAKNDNGCYYLDKPDPSPFFAAQLLYAGQIYGGGACTAQSGSQPVVKACWTLGGKSAITGFTIVPFHRAVSDSGEQSTDAGLAIGAKD